MNFDARNANDNREVKGMSMWHACEIKGSDGKLLYDKAKFIMSDDFCDNNGYVDHSQKRSVVVGKVYLGLGPITAKFPTWKVGHSEESGWYFQTASRLVNGKWISEFRVDSKDWETVTNQLYEVFKYFVENDLIISESQKNASYAGKK